MRNKLLSLSALLIVLFFLGGCTTPQVPVKVQPPIPEETPVEIPEEKAPEEAKACCVTCETGQPCGNSCIDATYVCTKPPGCACKAE